MNASAGKRVWRDLLRKSRGWLYRCLPAGLPRFHARRVAGFNRRWDLENNGSTQEGFSRICWENLLDKKRGGRILELCAGDGLVGSLGRWLEAHADWQAVGWEERALPKAQLAEFRPRMQLWNSLADWKKSWDQGVPDLVTSRSHRTNALLYRFLQRSPLRPSWVGVWNRSGRFLWAVQFARLGYRLDLCQDRMEIYSRR